MSQVELAKEKQLNIPESAALWILNALMKEQVFNDTWHAYNFLRWDIGELLLTVGGKFSPATMNLGPEHLHELRIVAPKGQEDNLRKILQQNEVKILERTHDGENVVVVVYRCTRSYSLDLLHFFDRK